MSKYKRAITKRVFGKKYFTKDQVREFIKKHYPECKFIITEEHDESRAPYEFWVAYADNGLSASFSTDNPRERDFEAGVAFTLRHLSENKRNSIDIGKFISDLSILRTWKSESEWADFVKRNIVEDF